MTPHSLCTIVIKFIGVSLLLNTLTTIPQALATSVSAMSSFGEDSGTTVLLGILLVVAAIVCCCIGVWLCLFKSDFIIQKLALDKGFKEDKLELNISQSTTIQIAIIVIGGLTVIESLPELIRLVSEFFQQKNVFREDPSFSWIIFQFLKSLIGYIMLSRSLSITNWIETIKKN